MIPGDSIMADKGFGVQDIFASYDVEVLYKFQMFVEYIGIPYLLLSPISFIQFRQYYSVDQC